MTKLLSTFIMLFPAAAFAQANDVGEVTFVGMITFLVLSIGIPALISYAIRVMTRDNIASYLGTFVIVGIAYIVARTMFGFVIDGGTLTVGLILLVPTMLGSVVAQTVYYIRLPRRKL